MAVFLSYFCVVCFSSLRTKFLRPYSLVQLILLVNLLFVNFGSGGLLVERVLPLYVAFDFADPFIASIYDLIIFLCDSVVVHFFDAFKRFYLRYLLPLWLYVYCFISRLFLSLYRYSVSFGTRTSLMILCSFLHCFR